VTISADPRVLVGLETPDDAGVYRLNDDVALVQSVDFFTPIVDDPGAWGRIAAANALSDIYAMGARPVTALNLVGWPRSLDFGPLGEVVAAAAGLCDEAGVVVIGGHSIDDAEPKFGLAATGLVHPDRIVRTNTADPGLDLVLTKPLGTGIISSAIKARRASASSIEAAVTSMSRLNRAASEAMIEVRAAAATDVTGFGLMGHLKEMLGDGLDAVVELDAVPLLPGAVELAAEGILPGGTDRNIEAVGPFVDGGTLDDARRAVLFDAQTSGGLLIAVTPEATRTLIDSARERGEAGAVRIGGLTEGTGRIKVVA
jgi:selenide,water dikinase